MGRVSQVCAQLATDPLTLGGWLNDPLSTADNLGSSRIGLQQTTIRSVKLETELQPPNIIGSSLDLCYNHWIEAKTTTSSLDLSENFISSPNLSKNRSLPNLSKNQSKNNHIKPKFEQKLHLITRSKQKKARSSSNLTKNYQTFTGISMDLNGSR